MECDGMECGEGKRVNGSNTGKYICPHNNLAVLFPNLVEEWSPHNEKQMSEYSPGSRYKAQWICSSDDNCGCHRWTTTIKDRTRPDNPTGCPFCSGRIPCAHNNLKITHPELVEQWHPDNPKMESFCPCANVIVKWKCPKNPCGCHIYYASINDRTHKTYPTNCPFCSHYKLCDHNNLEAMYPELKTQWDPSNLRPMKSYSPGCDKKVKWICKNNPKHQWRGIILNVTGFGRNKKSGCPHCSTSKGYSNSQIEWFNKIEQAENIDIQHALKPDGEYKIPGIGKVDGYCEDTNTVYEYHGDYWHGNPLVFDHTQINPTVKTSYGDLYAKTMERDNKIRKLGYKLVVKWETEQKN